MNRLLFFALLVSVALAAEEKYTDRYDNMDMQEIIANKKLLISYINCLLEKGRCTAEGKELSLHMKDAIETNCSKCTDKQKQNARIMMNHMKTAEAAHWEELKAKFDPENKYEETLNEFLAAKD